MEHNMALFKTTVISGVCELVWAIGLIFQAQYMLILNVHNFWGMTSNLARTLLVSNVQGYLSVHKGSQMNHEAGNYTE